MARSNMPKYAIRLALVWLVPLVNLLFGYALIVPCVLAILMTPIEVPKVRQRLCGARIRKQLPCLRVPALMRLAVLWLFQVWWIILWRVETSMLKLNAESGDDYDIGITNGSSVDAAADVALYAWSPRTLSVVLPCAGEGEFALNTVRSVYTMTPTESLEEIIVVDDGSNPPLGTTHLTDDIRAQYRVRLIRHSETLGLIASKKDGGDVAKGDIIVFFDCHVAPQRGWHASFLRLSSENYRRIVVPLITDLDVGTWQQRRGRHGQGKCYLTWDADFKWFDSDDPYVPVISGGLLAISRQWWNETGGYDDQMVGWGGENLDQSLRSWLCGGEIMLAKDALVAHMWRVASDPRTQPHYRVKAGAANKNRMRAAVAWFGEFGAKLDQFPHLSMGDKPSGGQPWYGDIGNILAVKQRLGCRSLAWFMHRFKNVYVDGGLIPKEIFNLKASSTGTCLTYIGSAGTSPNGAGKAILQPCKPDDDRQRWHGANRDTTRAGQPCCSGLKAWNTDQCIAGASSGAIRTFVCNIAGKNSDQAWQVSADGQLQNMHAGFMQSNCLVAQADGSIVSQGCSRHSDPAPWNKDNPTQPIESQLYQKAIQGGTA